MDNGRHRDRTHSGSSDSWSLVDVNDDIELSSASSVHSDLSDHEPHSDSESSEIDEEEMGFSTAQPTDESMLSLKGPKTEAGIIEAMKEGDDEKSESSDSCSLVDQPETFLGDDEAVEPVDTAPPSLGDASEVETEESEFSDDDDSHLDDNPSHCSDESEREDEAEEAVDEVNKKSEDEGDDLETDSDAELEVEDHENAMYIVDESEILEDSAAKHYVEPARVAKTLDSLSKRNDPLVDQFFEYLSMSETRVKTVIFITVLLAAATGIGIGRLISHSWMCLQVPGTTEPTFQCFGSEQEAVVFSSSGLPYRNLELDQLHFDPEYLKWNSPKNEEKREENAEKVPEPLKQCQRDLEEAKAELNAKAAMNRYIRQHAKLREEQTKKSMLSKLIEAEKSIKTQALKVQDLIYQFPHLAPTTSAQQSGLKKQDLPKQVPLLPPVESAQQANLYIRNLKAQIPQLAPKASGQQKGFKSQEKKNQIPLLPPPEVVHDAGPTTSKNVKIDPFPAFNDSICLATEIAIKNLTQSIYQSIKSWTNSTSTALTALATIHPDIVQSFDKISTLFQTFKISSIFDLPFQDMPPRPDFISSIPKMMKVAQIQVKSYAKKITTALTTQNFSTMASMVSNYKKHPMIRSLRKKVESALVTLGKWSKDPSVCFQNRVCDKIQKLAKFLKEHEQFGRVVGPRNSEIYTNYLFSFTQQQCQLKSYPMRCEQCWWTGNCPMQKCRWQSWQKSYKLRPHKFVLRNPQMMSIFDELQWETPLPVKPVKPCPADEKLNVCDYSMPSGDRPCFVSRAINRSNKVPPKPSGNGRPKVLKPQNLKKSEEKQETKEEKTSFSGWLFNRDKLRAEYRRRQDRAVQNKEFWLFQRSKLREELRQNSTFSFENPKKSIKTEEKFEKKSSKTYQKFEKSQEKQEKRQTRPGPTFYEPGPTFYTENYAQFSTFEEIDTNWLWDRSRKRAELRKEEVKMERSQRKGKSQNENWMFRRSQQRADLRQKERRR